MKVIYIYDALCGWCYGFSPVMTQFQETYKDQLTFEVVSGGMIIGSRIGPIGDVAPYIRWAYKDVENATGVKFGDDFLHKTLKIGKAIFTSIPPAIAMSVFKTMDFPNSVQFSAALQKGIYFDGIEPENLEAYGKIASEFGLNSESFIQKMKDPLYTKLAEEDFKKSQSLNVSGFPTVYLESEGNFHKISSGCVTFSTLENNYLTIKNKLK
jgi:putative protein-disulfide isomerase